MISTRDFVRPFQCKAIGSHDGDGGVNRKDKRWTHQNVAPGFAPVCGDSPRFLRGEPGISSAGGASQFSPARECWVSEKNKNSFFSVLALSPHVTEFFPAEQSVNTALPTLIHAAKGASPPRALSTV